MAASSEEDRAMLERMVDKVRTQVLEELVATGVGWLMVDYDTCWSSMISFAVWKWIGLMLLGEIAFV
jgi:hypothetical protein